MNNATRPQEDLTMTAAWICVAVFVLIKVAVWLREDVFADQE